MAGRALIDAGAGTEEHVVSHFGIAAGILNGLSALCGDKSPRERSELLLGKAAPVFFPFLRRVLRGAREPEGRQLWRQEEQHQGEIEMLIFDAIALPGTGSLAWRAAAPVELDWVALVRAMFAICNGSDALNSPDRIRGLAGGGGGRPRAEGAHRRKEHRRQAGSVRARRPERAGPQRRGAAAGR